MTLANPQLRDSKILDVASALYRSERKYLVFEAVYHHKKRAKSVSEIVERSGLTRMQVLQAGGQLKAMELVGQTKVDGETAYEQKSEVMGLKTRVLSLAKNPDRLKKLLSERQATMTSRVSEPKGAQAVSFVKHPQRRTSRKRKPPKASSASVRLALLVTNPERTASLQTGVEARDIQRAIESASKGDAFDVKVVLAPTFDDLIDSLNRLNPQILHFSGHGGGSAILLDNERAGQDGGEVLDFDLAARLIDATDATIRLIVLAACDTVVGAEKLLAKGRAIVAMSDSIDDEAACAFSARFYKSLADGVAVEKALEQAKLLLEQKGYEDAELPTLIAESGEAKAHSFV